MILQDYKNLSIEPEITKNPSGLMEGWNCYIYYALVMIVSGFVFGLAVLGG